MTPKWHLSLITTSAYLPIILDHIANAEVYELEVKPVKPPESLVNGLGTKDVVIACLRAGNGSASLKDIRAALAANGFSPTNPNPINSLRANKIIRSAGYGVYTLNKKLMAKTNNAHVGIRASLEQWIGQSKEPLDTKTLRGLARDAKLNTSNIQRDLDQLITQGRIKRTPDNTFIRGSNG